MPAALKHRKLRSRSTDYAKIDGRFPNFRERSYNSFLMCGQGGENSAKTPMLHT
jgi:hypothetical protein